MKCAICGFDNEAREAYCRACGSKITVSLSEVEVDLIDKADQQVEQASEEEIRRWLVVAICLFLLAVTAKVLFGPSTWPTFYAVPSASGDAEHSAASYEHKEAFDPLTTPIPK